MLCGAAADASSRKWAEMAAWRRSKPLSIDALDRRGIDGKSFVPWYFPDIQDYSERLRESRASVISYISLFPLPTPLPRRHNIVAGNLCRKLSARVASRERLCLHRGSAPSAAPETMRRERQLDRGLRAAAIRGAEAAGLRIQKSRSSSLSLLGMTENSHRRFTRGERSCAPAAEFSCFR